MTRLQANTHLLLIGLSLVNCRNSAKVFEHPGRAPALSGLISNGPCFVSATDLGHVECLTSSGEILWRAETCEPLKQRGAVLGSSLWFACDDGEWVVLNKKDGQPRWKQTGKKIPASALVSDGIHGFIASENGSVEAIDETGQRLWTQSLGTLLWAQGETLIASSDRKVTAVEAATGKALWQSEKPLVGISGTAQRVALLHADGALSLVDLASGETRWSGRVKNPLPTTLSIDRGSIWVGTADSELLEISLDDGSQKSRTALPEKLAAPIHDGIAILNGSSGCALQLDTQQQWCVDHPLRGQPFVNDGVLLLAPRDGRVLGFRLPKQK